MFHIDIIHVRHVFKDVTLLFAVVALHEILWDFDQDIPGENDSQSMDTD